MLSIIIPAYNEEKRIVSTIKKIEDYFKTRNKPYEIIVVDDGSKDKTIEKVNSINSTNVRLIKNPKNMGKGYAVKTGVMNSKKEWILFSDADLSTPIEMLDRFVQYMDHYDIIIGSRVAKGAKIEIKQPFYRRIPGKVFPLLVQLFIMRGIKDTQCGFKLFKKECAMFLFKKQKINGFSFDAEILYLAKKYKFKIKEVPINWANDLDSKVNPIKHSFKMFVELLKIKINDIMGIYK
jgi:dolichyl-phosphate beta-glucosyltransferase